MCLEFTSGWHVLKVIYYTEVIRINVARPTKRTPEIIGKLEQAFSLDCTVAEACFQAGIAESTYFEWCKSDPQLSERMKALKNKMVLKARQTIFNDMNDPTTAKWYLERKRKEEFSMKLHGVNADEDSEIPESYTVVIERKDCRVPK